MAQFEIVSNAKKGEITLNHTELKMALQKALTDYDYEVTEANLKDAKADKAKLNKLVNALDDRRKEVKSAYSEPLVKFEAQMKELTSLAKEASNNLKHQIDVFDDKEKEMKKRTIIAHYDASGFDLVPLDAIFDKRWLNKSCKDWDKQMDEKINSIKQTLSLINALDEEEEDREEIKVLYLKSLDVSKAIAEFERNKAYKARLAKDKEIVEKPVNEALPRSEEQIEQSEQKERILVEFRATRPFYDAMNQLIREYHPEVRIIERGE